MKSLEKYEETIAKIADFIDLFEKKISPYSFVITPIFFLVMFLPLLITSVVFSMFAIPYLIYKDNKRKIKVPDFTPQTTTN